MSKELNLSAEQVDYLLSPVAIRERAQKIWALTEAGKGKFQIYPAQLKPTVDYVLNVINKNYPDLKIPFHSRWGHFRAGKIDRAQKFNAQLATSDFLEKARCQLDLVITSVLLDAGAGAEWKYFEEETKASFNRSEGLGVASYHMFCSGVMNSDKKSLKADVAGLKSVTAEDLKKYFQVTDSNPLVGVEGRVQLLNNLGRALENKTIFKDGRPGNIIDYLMEKHGSQIPATSVLRAVLDGLGVIWPGRLSANGVNLGDMWIHSQLGAAGSFESLVPIHKLSQWMTYSLIEPIEDAGLKVTGVENLTGLAEYRNGGLMIDSGLLALRNVEDMKKPWAPDSELIIEWRALTILLLDQIGAEVQKALGKNPADFPLAKVLEGGTWWAGRFMANDKRAGGVPPLNIVSDGTVF
ncbi:URC4/urg3 family protein [bacterium]|nr:URC4/urg3 family protein [bacterium]